MKIAVLFVMVGIFLPMVSYSQEIEVEIGKIYVKPAQLFFTEQEMFAYVSGRWIPVNAIHSDVDGFYVKPMISYRFVRWTCPECMYNNDSESTTCQRPLRNGGVCGVPRPHNK